MYQDALQHIVELEQKINTCSNQLIELSTEYSNLNQSSQEDFMEETRKRKYAQFIDSRNILISNQEIKIVE